MEGSKYTKKESPWGLYPQQPGLLFGFLSVKFSDVRPLPKSLCQLNKFLVLIVTYTHTHTYILWKAALARYDMGKLFPTKQETTVRGLY